MIIDHQDREQTLTLKNAPLLATEDINELDLTQVQEEEQRRTWELDELNEAFISDGSDDIRSGSESNEDNEQGKVLSTNIYLDTNAC